MHLRALVPFLLAGALAVPLAVVDAAAQTSGEGIDLLAERTAVAGEVRLSWSGGDPTYVVYRSDSPVDVVVPANRIAERTERDHVDAPPAGDAWFYSVGSRSDCFEPLADSFVDDAFPDTPHGTAPELAAWRDAEEVRRAFLKFSLDTVPSGARIRQARLLMEQTFKSGADVRVTLRRATDVWTESGLTHATAPSVTGSYDEPAHDVVPGQKAWNATTLVQEWVDGDRPNRGLVLEVRPSSVAGGAQYHAREAGRAVAPRLCVEWEDRADATLAELRGESRSEVDAYREAGVYESASFDVPRESGDPVEEALTFLETYREMYGLEDPYRELYLDRITPVFDDAQLVVFGYRERNVPYRARYFAVRLRGDAVVATSVFHRGRDRSPFPETEIVIGTDQAFEALAEALETDGIIRAEPWGEASLLWYTPAVDVDPKRPRLTYRLGAHGLESESERQSSWVGWVDVETGEVLHFKDDEQDGDRTGEDFDIETANNTESSTCWLLTTSDDEWFDEHGATGWPGAASDPYLDGSDAWAYAHDNYHYWADTHGWWSWNGAGTPLFPGVPATGLRGFAQVEVMVHVGGSGYKNAAYSRGCGHLKFADGWVQPDIFGHEFGHAVVRWTSNLKYENQSGAINEAIADFFGSMQDLNWEIGEGIPAAEGPGRLPIRDMSHPPRFHDPDRMADKRPDVAEPDKNDNDFGWVHINSGIINKVHYLLAEGGDHYGIGVDGMGREKTADLIFATLYDWLTPKDTFWKYRNAVIYNARERRDAGKLTTQDVCDVINAFSSVGLGRPDIDCDGWSEPDDGDADDDGWSDEDDLCPFVKDYDNRDLDGDGDGDVCDPDLDGDGTRNVADNCPTVADDGTDSDGDGVGDACDDDDGDQVLDVEDNCPDDPNPRQDDADRDGEGDACDRDDDQDGVTDFLDNCPLRANSGQVDRDSDGVGDACDNCALDRNADQINTDRDSSGDACDADDDNDGIEDEFDNCPRRSNPRQIDNNEDGIGMLCDADELRQLDGLRAESRILFSFEDTTVDGPFAFPVFPCRAGETCPNFLGPDFEVTVGVSMDPPYAVRIVDDRGFVYKKTKISPTGNYELVFRPDAEYHYQDARFAEEPLEGRRYYLEMHAPEGAEPGLVTGSIEVVSDRNP